jgi:hypothetical protein
MTSLTSTFAIESQQSTLDAKVSTCLPAPSQLAPESLALKRAFTMARTSGAAGSASTATTAAISKEAAAWFPRATAALVERARAGKRGASAKAQTEARQRSAALSTSSSTVGVSFAGAPFQADYFQRLFQRRGELAWAVLGEVASHVPVQAVAAGQNDGRYAHETAMRVASFGGGPGMSSSD